MNICGLCGLPDGSDYVDHVGTVAGTALEYTRICLSCGQDGAQLVAAGLLIAWILDRLNPDAVPDLHTAMTRERP